MVLTHEEKRAAAVLLISGEVWDDPLAILIDIYKPAVQSLIDKGLIVPVYTFTEEGKDLAVAAYYE